MVGKLELDSNLERAALHGEVLNIFEVSETDKTLGVRHKGD